MEVVLLEFYVIAEYLLDWKVSMLELRMLR